MSRVTRPCWYPLKKALLPPAMYHSCSIPGAQHITGVNKVILCHEAKDLGSNFSRLDKNSIILPVFFQQISWYFYRPQVMFLLTCVILFTGWGWLRNMHHRSHDQHPGGWVCIQGRGGLHPGGGAQHPGEGGSAFKRGGVGQTSPLHLKWESGRYASYWNASLFITARKHSLRRLCFYTCLSFCPQGGVLSQYALQVVYQHTLQQVWGGGDIPACLAGFQAHTQWGS